MSPDTVSLRLVLAYDPTVNFALQQNDVRMVRNLAVENTGERAIDDLAISVTSDPGVFDPWVGHISRIEPGTTYNLRDVPLALSPSRLAAQLEREAGQLHVEARVGQTTAHRSSYPFEILAYNEWSRTSLPELLAAFVLPNQPAVAEVLKRASRFLREATGDDAFDGYQRRSAQRVIDITAAIYRGIADLGLGYINPPASFEASGQKVRLPERLLADQRGTCLDLTLLMAGALEQAGLHPLLVLTRSHAFVAVWLADNMLPEPAHDDPIALRKRIDADEVRAVEATGVAQGLDFASAVRLGRALLEDADEFRQVIDVVRARRTSVRPLPVRQVDGEWVPDPTRPADLAAAQRPDAGVVPTVREWSDTAAPAAPGAPGAPESTEARLERWKAKLLDLTLRNRLLNLKLDNKGVLPIQTTEVAALEDALAAGRAFEVLAKLDPATPDAPLAGDLLRQRAGLDPVATALAEGVANGRLHTDLPPKELERRVVGCYRSARTAAQESGSNTLYLAVGLLRWFESDASETARLAPIVLLPVELVRGSGTASYRLRATGEEPRINITLLKKLETEFGLSAAHLAELPPDSAGLDIPLIFKRFRDAVASQRRWEVVDRALVSEFSFNKHVMWLDLQDRTSTLLANPVFEHLMHGQGAAYPLPAPFPSVDRLDAERHQRDDLCVVDADSSQLAAVFAAKDGASFVLQGPPGTGKSQTITNLVAQLIGAGKTVLFVSEKRVALEVVRTRLERIGLGPYCLELHSNKAQKRAVLEQLREPLVDARRHAPSEWEAHAAEAQALRTKLNTVAERLHEPGPYGVSLFAALAIRQKLLDAPEIPLPGLDASIASRDWVTERRRALEDVAVSARAVGIPGQHPWRGTRPGTWMPGLEAELSRPAGAVATSTTTMAQAAKAAAAPCGFRLRTGSDAELGALDALADVLLEAPPSPLPRLFDPAIDGERHRLTTLAQTSADRVTSWTQLAEHYEPSLLELDLDALHARYLRYASWFFLFALILLWSARATVRTVARGGKLRTAGQTRDDLAAARRVRDADRALAAEATAVGATLGVHWRGTETDWSGALAQLDWIGRFRALCQRLATPGALPGVPEPLLPREAVQQLDRLVSAERARLDAGADTGLALRQFREAWAGYRRDRDALFARLGLEEPAKAEASASLRATYDACQRWTGATGSLRVWCDWQDELQRAAHPVLEPLLTAHRQGQVPAGGLGPAFERALGDWLIDDTIRRDDLLRSFRGATHDEVVQRFRAHDAKLQEAARAEVRARVAARVPEHLDVPGEPAALKTELAKKAGHMPIRRLMSRIPNLLPRLTPCVLMSPLSVAQYLDPAMPLFDVVVFDEASQIPPWDAVGAIARGRQVIVVGDSKQLPPTAFFEKGGDDEAPDDDDLVELESVLDECVRAGLRSHLLGWHYRSRHETLIAFSNHHYYENRLNTFPSAANEVETLGVKWRHVPDGFYDRGKSRSNEGEARAVVAEIERRLSDPELSQKSIGIVTFSQAQQNKVEDMLDELRQRRPELEHFFADGLEEPLFCKNLENVQGDERDVMLFSVCYGPDAGGRVTQAFGPLNRSGGERRLNVAVTRARELLIVFSTLTADQIDLSRTKAVGAAHLKTFLDYARRGPRAIAEATTLDPGAGFDSPFEEQVCERLRAAGHRVDIQVGCGGYRIDMAVRDPEHEGRYLLGVECDGATYHSSRSARDRDRIRQAVLESLGWRLFRIWSLDWWYDSAGVLARLEAAIEAAKRAPRGLGGSAGVSPEAAPPSRPAQPRSISGTAPTIAASATSATPLTGGAFESSESSEAQPERLMSMVPLAPSGAAAPASRLPRQASEYAVTTLEVEAERGAWDDPRENGRIAVAILRVVEGEAPIHVDELTRRVLAAWGGLKATQKAVARVQNVASQITGGRRPQLVGHFYWAATQDPATWPGFRVPGDEASRREAEYLPTREVANAAAWLLAEGGSFEREELIRELARLFGYKSTGRKVRLAMEEGIRDLIEGGRGRLLGDRVSL
jgi:very-short-patch-repair endonuclease